MVLPSGKADCGSPQALRTVTQIPVTRSSAPGNCSPFLSALTKISSALALARLMFSHGWLLLKVDAGAMAEAQHLLISAGTITAGSTREECQKIATLPGRLTYSLIFCTTWFVSCQRGVYWVNWLNCADLDLQEGQSFLAATEGFAV